MATTLETLNSQLADLNKQVKQVYDSLPGLRATEAEYKRQYDEKVAQKDRANYLFIESNLLAPATQARQAAEALYNDLIDKIQKKNYEIDAAKLNPANIKEEEAAQTLNVLNASTQKAAFVQGTTKYLIYGTIALVILIGAIVILRKKLAA